MIDVPWQRPLRILAYGDSNTWGYVARGGGSCPMRLRDDERWPGILQQALGPGVQVLVDAISGRRTDLDGDGDTPTTPSVSGAALNGLRHAEASGLAHAPVDIVIVMLGTNDLVVSPPRTEEAIASACVRVAQALVRGATALTPDRTPRVLLVSPVAFGGDGSDRQDVPGWPALWQRSRELPGAIEAAALCEGFAYVDGNQATSVGGPDRIHLDETDHRRLGRALASPVLRLLSSD